MELRLGGCSGESPSLVAKVALGLPPYLHAHRADVGIIKAATGLLYSTGASLAAEALGYVFFREVVPEVQYRAIIAAATLRCFRLWYRLGQDYLLFSSYLRFYKGWKTN